MRIDHLYADTGDDDIAIKSGAINSPGGDDPARDITITDCTFKHGHGLSIGYANVTGQNVKVTAAQGDAILKMAGGNVTIQ